MGGLWEGDVHCVDEVRRLTQAEKHVRLLQRKVRLLRQLGSCGVAWW